jgi:CRISPR-associated protein Cas5d
MTPSAARGLLEAVLWKPAITWHIERIRVLKEIKFTAFRRNEVRCKAFLPKASIIRSGGPAPLYFAEEDRVQRNTVALADVDYVIEAYFTMTHKAGPDDNIKKFVEMFNRRVQKGQHFHQPYFGCREFAAEILPADDAPPTFPQTCDLGLVLWDVRFCAEGNAPVFFSARLEDGVLEVPTDLEAAVTTVGTSDGGRA